MLTDPAVAGLVVLPGRVGPQRSSIGPQGGPISPGVCSLQQKVLQTKLRCLQSSHSSPGVLSRRGLRCRPVPAPGPAPPGTPPWPGSLPGLYRAGGPPASCWDPGTPGNTWSLTLSTRRGRCWRRRTGRGWRCHRSPGRRRRERRDRRREYTSWNLNSPGQISYLSSDLAYSQDSPLQGYLQCFPARGQHRVRLYFSELHFLRLNRIAR